MKNATRIFTTDNRNRASLTDSDLKVPFVLGKTVKQLSSVTLVFSYPDDIFEVRGVEMVKHNEDLYYTAIDGVIRVVYSTLQPYSLDEGELLMTVSLGLKKDRTRMITDAGQLSFTGYGEFGDYNDQVLEGVTLKYGQLESRIFRQLMDNTDIAVYPNPANDRLNIRNAEGADLTVIDVLGRSILKVNNIPENMVLNISSLVTGTYMLKMKRNNDLFYRKITVIK
jgi:hypothetical protein